MSPTVEQRTAALEEANRRRTAFADLGRQVKAAGPAGREQVAVVLLNPPDEFANMPVHRLLRQTHRVGRVQVDRLFRHAGIRRTEIKLGELTGRQRLVMARALSRPTQTGAGPWWPMP